MAITDHNGFYGVVRFSEAARERGLKTIFGTELTLTSGEVLERAGQPDPAGEHLLLLARGPQGYARLSARSPRPTCAAGRRAARSSSWKSWRRPCAATSSC